MKVGDLVRHKETGELYLVSVIYTNWAFRLYELGDALFPRERAHEYEVLNESR